MAIRWATGNAKGLLSPMNVANYEDNATFNPIPPRIDPQGIWRDLFGSPQGSDAAARLARKKSILDYVDKRYAGLSARLGASDRAKIDQHLTKLRELEQGLAKLPTGGACPKTPAQVDTGGYDPRAGFMDSMSSLAMTTDSVIPKVGKYFMDMLVMALACDLTAVASLAVERHRGQVHLPLAGPDAAPPLLPARRRLQARRVPAASTPGTPQQHLYLLQQMDAVDWAATPCWTRAWCSSARRSRIRPATAG
jgi:hypothetical protein